MAASQTIQQCSTATELGTLLFVWRLHSLELGLFLASACSVLAALTVQVPSPCTLGQGRGTPGDALEGKGPQRRPQKRLDGRLEEVAKAVGGGYCRLQLPLRLALPVGGTVAGHRLGALEGEGGGLPLPTHPWGPPPYFWVRRKNVFHGRLGHWEGKMNSKKGVGISLLIGSYPECQK